MKRFSLLLALLVVTLNLSAKVIYLVPNQWTSDNAALFVHSWGGGSDIAGKMEKVSDNLYKYDIGNNTNCLFVRQSSDLGNNINWDKKWNQTEDLTIPADKNCWTHTTWGQNGGKCKGTWSSYTESGDTTPDTPEKPIIPDGPTKTIYLNTGSETLWHQDDAQFFVHSWDNSGHFDVQMQWLETRVYQVEIPESHNNIIFLRLAPEATQVVWDGELFWNKTADLTIPSSKDCYTILGWGEKQGGWTVYGSEPYPTKPIYDSAVPSACPDVMLQGFYWDSNQDKYYGCTRWWNLEKEADEISSYFDLVWLPPSALSTGGVGYIPKQYSNQNGDWGNEEELRTLIRKLHDGGAKVVADMVVNHIDSKDGWCAFYEQDFGPYGKFQLDASYMCYGDEMNWDDGARDCRPTGGYDDGYGDEMNYGAARDLAHDNEKVREMCRAYAKWMIDIMGYDGFRYDYCKGFHMSHVDDYNANAGVYFSVIEYYDGNRDVLWDRIKDANENTLAFDFGMKFNVLNDGIAQFNYAKCKSPNCLIGMGKGKWAVNFIDNHDTFERGNGCDFGRDAMSDAMRDRLLQANAFILSMPGVPCLFYPHWKKYSAELKPMILARKAVGVHSESAVSDEIIGNGYRAVVTGTKGSLILELGDACSSQSWGYSEVAAGPGYKMYITYEASAPMLTVHTPSTSYRTPTMNVKMTSVGFGGAPTIYYTLDGSDPKSSATKKTYAGEITISGTLTLKAYAELGGMQSEVQTYTYTYLPPQEAPITISFKKPADWAEAYLYTWTADDEHPTGSWPGMLLEDMNGGGFYYHTLNNTDAREIHFIFNDGSSEQSQDLLTYDDVCYAWEGNKAIPVPCWQGSGTTTNMETMQPVESSQLNLSLPMYNVLGQQVDASYHGIVIQNGYKYIRY